jgi:hypothetical protein
MVKCIACKESTTAIQKKGLRHSPRKTATGQCHGNERFWEDMSDQSTIALLYLLCAAAIVILVWFVSYSWGRSYCGFGSPLCGSSVGEAALTNPEKLRPEYVE